MAINTSLSRVLKQNKPKTRQKTPPRIFPFESIPWRDTAQLWLEHGINPRHFRPFCPWRDGIRSACGASHSRSSVCLEQKCTLSLTAALPDIVPSQATSFQSFWPRSHSLLVMEQLPALGTAFPFITTLRDLALKFPAGNVRLPQALPTTASPPTPKERGLKPWALPTASPSFP